MANVNVYAGDNYLPAADAKYNNLIWEEISGWLYTGLFKVFKDNTILYRFTVIHFYAILGQHKG